MHTPPRTLPQQELSHAVNPKAYIKLVRLLLVMGQFYLEELLAKCKCKLVPGQRKYILTTEARTFGMASGMPITGIDSAAWTSWAVLLPSSKYRKGWDLSCSCAMTGRLARYALASTAASREELSPDSSRSRGAGYCSKHMWTSVNCPELDQCL